MSRKDDIWAKTGGICHLCDLQIESISQMSKDHFIPKNKGGTNALSNLYPAHFECNWERGSQGVEDYKRYGKRIKLTVKCKCRGGIKARRKAREGKKPKMGKHRITQSKKPIPTYFPWQEEGIKKALQLMASGIC